ncbi:MAG: hypothetical protein ACEPOW_05775 [Bacteroidales bacterium]
MKTERKNTLNLNKVTVANVNNARNNNAKASGLGCTFTIFCDSGIAGCLLTELADCNG